MEQHIRCLLRDQIDFSLETVNHQQRQLELLQQKVCSITDAFQSNMDNLLEIPRIDKGLTFLQNNYLTVLTDMKSVKETQDELNSKVRFT